MPGCMASSTSRTFSATDQRRRRCTEVMTSTRRNGSSELLDIVVLIGACLCLIGYAACPVKMGCAPLPWPALAQRRQELVRHCSVSFERRPFAIFLASSRIPIVIPSPPSKPGTDVRFLIFSTKIHFDGFHSCLSILAMQHFPGAAPMKVEITPVRVVQAVAA